MTLNLTGSHFGETSFGYTNQNAANVMAQANDHKAVLFVFMPYQNQFGDVGLRPFQYRFDENFLDETKSVTDLAGRGSAGSGRLMQQLMAKTNLNDYMMPSVGPTMMLRSSLLSDKYRFILIFTQKGEDLQMPNTFASSLSSSKTRRIYTGYFDQEPFNAATFTSHKRTLNSHAHMIVTHRTVLGTATESNQFGPSTYIRTRVSDNVVNSSLANPLISHQSNKDQNLFLMTPDRCVNSMDVTEEGFSFSSPGAHSDITRDHGANVIQDYLEQPSRNMSTVVKGMMQFQADVSNRDRLSMNRVDNIFQDKFLDESASRIKLAGYMQLQQSNPTSALDLDLNATYSPLDIARIVNNDLEVIPFDLPRPTMQETANHQDGSYTNQFSFLIASVVTPIMNAAGLNAWSFVYQIATMRGEVVNDFQTFAAETTAVVPNADKVSMVVAAQNELATGIFATIFKSVGSFEVKVNANATGMTTVNLSLVEQGYKHPADFEMPSCLGGLISPLLGDRLSQDSNSERIETLYHTATGHNGAPKNFNEEDRSFMDHANQLPWPQQMTIDPNHPQMNLRDFEID